MTVKGVISAVSRVADTKAMKSVPALNLSSTYIVRGAKELSKTGNTAPWLPRSTYIADCWSAKFKDGLNFYKASI